MFKHLKAPFSFYDELSNQVQRFLKKYLIWGFII